MKRWIYFTVFVIYGFGAACILWDPETYTNYKSGEESVAANVWAQLLGWSLLCSAATAGAWVLGRRH